MNSDGKKRRSVFYSISASQSSTDSDDEYSNAVFSVTVNDNKHVEDGLTLVDDFYTKSYFTNTDNFFGGEFNHYLNVECGEDPALLKLQEKDQTLAHLIPDENDIILLNPYVKEVPKLNNNNNKDKDKDKKKKAKKRSKISICTSNCKYEVVRRVAKRFGLRDVSDDDTWNVYWTDLSVSIDRVKEMKRFQKINHFPGMIEICRKDLLARNLTRMLKIFPKDYNFFPKTWCLPADLGEMCAYARSRRNSTFICKPDAGCQGKGIFLTKNLKDIKPFEKMICQIYLCKPFLVDGYKFDLRIYVLITSCDPLRIYVYNDGLVRFATCRYREPTQSNVSNVFMHLTNYAVNKYSRTYVVDDEAGSKRKISTLNNWFRKKELDVEEIWYHIDDVIIKTIISAYSVLKHSYQACFPGHEYTYACFELLGFDVILDYKLKPYILEVNHSPSFHTDSQIDKDIKEGLLMDTFGILNLALADKKKILEEDRKRVRDRLLQGILHKDNNNNSSNAPSPLKDQIEWENRHLGNFRKVYPGEDCERFERFFNQKQGSVFQDTAASRAREVCTRIQREEMEIRARIDASKRPGMKSKDMDRARPESPINRERNKSKPLPSKRRKQTFHSLSRRLDSKNCKLNSFDPEPIIESEERERVSGLSQRDFLIRSCGIMEQIYRAMMKNGSLREADERKYGLYGKVGYINKMITACAKKQLPTVSLLQQQPQNKPRTIFVETQVNEEVQLVDCLQPFSGDISSHLFSGLKVTCNNVPIFTRPCIPSNTCTDDITKDGDFRSTKTQVARSLTNCVRLQELEKREQRQQQ